MLTRQKMIPGDMMVAKRCLGRNRQTAVYALYNKPNKYQPSRLRSQPFQRRVASRRTNQRRPMYMAKKERTRI